MSYAFGDQLDKLSVLLGDSNSSVDDAFPLSVRKKELNRGELHFSVDAKAIPEYATGTISGTSFTFPSDWIETFVLVVDGKVITNDYEVSLSDYERYASDSAEPWHYIWKVSGSWVLSFFSSSYDGKTYKLWYFKKPTTELDAVSDVSLLDEQYREAPVYWAAAELLGQIGKVTLATDRMNHYAAYVSQATQDLEKHYIKKEYPRPDMGTVKPINSNKVGGYGITV